MSALNNQTNINRSRFFFATTENGEQQLALDFGTTGGAVNLSTMSVAITGDQGNSVIVNTAPQYLATEFMVAEDALITGTNSTYFTMSTLNATLVGTNISVDRFPGTGTTCIEAYSGNGGNRGFEFLSRGVNSQLVSTIYNGINTTLSTVGAVGATARLGGNGSFITGDATCGAFSATEYPSGTGGFGQGRPCYGIRDISGADNATSYARWTIGTSGLPTGGDVGSDFTIFAYTDAGNYNNTPMKIQRSDGSMQINNISSISASAGGTAKGQVFPILTDNTEFGAPTNDVFVIAGATSNQSLYGTTFPVIFSTPVSTLNPNYETLLNINWANSLSTGSNHVNFKIGFSTATAYTNIVQTSYVPGLAGSWTPSDLPSANTPVGHTNICAVLDPDGLNAQGDGFLYVMGQLSDPNAPADQLYIAKGATSEPTRNALTYKTI